jgi:regulator of protease activity HflC (stomatin/prohibitin superfamily)
VRRIAEAQRFKLETEAQGQSVAVQRVFDAIKAAKPDDKLIAIQYLETLKQMADGRATKIYLPYEASGVLGALGGIGDLFQDTKTPPPTSTSSDTEPSDDEMA